MADLCLGTVQFGMKYGVNNQIGRQPTWEESFEMIDFALDAGIDTIDTARAYGEAELVLGAYLKENSGRKGDVRIISKLRPNVVEEGCTDAYSVVRSELESSLDRLGIDVLEGYLLHTPDYIYREDIVDAMARMRDEGLVRHVGVSIYGMEEGFAAIDTGVMDYVQLPYSILDQRGVKSGFISAAKKAGMHVAARSAFLQGLFMMDPDALPSHLDGAKGPLNIMREIIERHGVSMVDAILGFLNAEADIDHIVFGVEMLSQLEENLGSFKKLDVPQECIRKLKESVSAVDQSIIFPSLWSNGKKAD